MIPVGLTGGIGSGKSTVSQGMVERGAVLVDADAIVRELQEPGQPVLAAMVDRFGDGILDGAGRLDRAGLAGVVFSDADARKELERIVHPAVGDEIRSRLASLAPDDDVVILDIPLLAEGLRRRRPPAYPVSGVLVVDCPPETAVARLVEHRGFSADDARARIANQASREERLALADHVVDNSGDVDALAGRIDAAWAWAQGLDQVHELPPSPPPTAPDPAEERA